MYCPFQLLRNYIRMRPLFKDDSEIFFIFRDQSPVYLRHLRNTLKTILTLAGFDHTIYSSHSLQGGHSCDLMKLGFSVETIKKLGHWHSNAVYTYLKC